MSEADVHSIESLEDLHRAVVHLSEKLMLQGYQLRSIVTNAERHFSQECPSYWRGQLRRAEQHLSEALDRLSRKQSTLRSGDAVPATEEKKQVARWKARVRLCHERIDRARSVAVEMEQNCDKMKGPIADLMELAEVTLPQASRRLSSLIERLQAYQNNLPPGQ
ncbi:hypothetical protein [Aporhodopirellula aestuarii]|uniref:Uncharacterized protein n=1 Tax=Aporhodopirellula aestuarii TaxID=2950107 RepID=A0ABT0TY84_9BACT|nr:hypothetical protein [Aporhodopirellula aestuarii]MCM2369556.1 hypothetical protein [Aporhodopirellula aestuarii]